MFGKLKADAKVDIYWTDPAKRAANPGVAAKVNGYDLTVAQLGEECLARHGVEVLEGEVNRLILQQALQRRKIEITTAALEAEVARAALSFGVQKRDGTADVEKWLADITAEDGVTKELYIRDAVWPTVALKLLVQEKVQVTNADLQKGFEANFGPRVEVLGIVLNDQRTAHKVWSLARDNNTREFIGQLARQYSVEPISKANSGRVPPIRKHGGQENLEAAAFKLQPGELSGVVMQGDKYFILHCLGLTKPVVTDFNLVKSELYEDIKEKKLRIAMRKEFDGLLEASQLDNFLTGQSKQPRRTAGAPIISPKR